jgi:hypothetical protein
MENIVAKTDWITLTQFFPAGWEDKAKELGALIRKRNVKSASDLLQLLMLHIADDNSLVTTVNKARLMNIAELSDVGLLKKLKVSSEWLRWLAYQMLNNRGQKYIPPPEFVDYRILAIDGSVITEPGSTGTDLRLHYCIDLFSLNCNEFIVSDQSLGESYKNFKVEKGDLIIADRAYGRYSGIKYILENGADFLTRYMNRAYSLEDLNGKKIHLLNILKTLKIGKVIDLQLQMSISTSDVKLPVRVIAIRKSDLQAADSVRKAKQNFSKKQMKINNETLEYHKYIILIASIKKDISADKILELYRLRWQIELAFKHLKSIFGLGHLPKKDPEASRAWLHGKLFVALLADAIIDEGQSFSPWGYPLRR